MNRPPGPTAAALACRQLLGAQVDRLLVLARPPRSAVYRGRTPASPTGTVIIKLYSGASAWRALKERTAIARSAPATGFAAPQVLASGALRGAPEITALILQDLGSRTLHRAVADGSMPRAQALQLLGEVRAAFHRLPTRTPREHVAKQFLGRVRRLRTVLPADLAVAAEAALEEAEHFSGQAPVVWSHGDLHLQNVLLPAPGANTAAPGVVDYEEAGDSFAALDLAQSIVTTDSFAPVDFAALAHDPGDAHDVMPSLVLCQAVYGWYYAQRDGRDEALWHSRVTAALAQGHPRTRHR